MSSIVDRYVTAVGGHLPQSIREDVEQELRATIRDMLEAEYGHLDPEEAAVKAVESLGDPARLAREYNTRPRYLIGPASFDMYRRLLTILLAVMVPLVLVISLVSRLVSSDGSALAAVGAAIGDGLHTAVWVSFWVTAVFGVLEWTGVRTDSLRTHAWTVKDLPAEAAPRRVSLADVVFSATFSAATIVVIVVQHFRSVFSDATGPIPFLSPELWKGWLPVVLALLACSVAVEIALYRKGRYTLGLTVASTAADVAFGAAGSLMLLTQTVINPAWRSANETIATVLDRSAEYNSKTIAAVFFLVIVAASIAEAWVRYHRHRRQERRP